MEHAIADETAAVADQNADLSQLFRQLHAGGDHFFAAGFAPHDLEQAHDIGRTEKVSTDYGCGPPRRGCDLVDIQGRSVAGQDRSRLANAIEFAEDLFLKGHAFEYSFDHHVGLAEVLITQGGLDQVQTFVY